MKLLSEGTIIRPGRVYILASAKPQTGLVGGSGHGYSFASLGRQMAWSAKVGHGVMALISIKVDKALAVSDVVSIMFGEAAVFDAGEDFDPLLEQMIAGTMTPDLLDATTDELAEEMAAILSGMDAPKKPDAPVIPGMPEPQHPINRSYILWGIAGVGVVGLLIALVAAARG